MPAPQPLFVGERTSAKMLQIPHKDFLRLVDAGVLPKPVNIGGEFKRWSVRELEAIKTGEAMDGDFRW